MFSQEGRLISRSSLKRIFIHLKKYSNMEPNLQLMVNMKRGFCSVCKSLRDECTDTSTERVTDTWEVATFLQLPPAPSQQCK